MKKDYRNKGFTLVEMIVVIVIIGILLAILVPGMFKYIQKAKEQQAIVECRAVVTAAQTLALEQYGKSLFNPLEFQNNDFRKKICAAASVSGSIVFGVNFSDMPSTEVAYLEYKYSENIIVVYDIKNASIFYIKEQNNLSDMDNRIKNYGKIFEEKYGNNYNNNNVWNVARKEYYESSEAALTDAEKDLLSAKTTLSNSTLDSLKWMPCRYKNSDSTYEHYFVATKTEGTFYVSLAYYQGSYYYFLGNNGTTGANSMPDASEQTISKLINAKTNAEDLSKDKDIWVKIVK